MKQEDLLFVGTKHYRSRMLSFTVIRSRFSTRILSMKMTIIYEEGTFFENI